MKNCTVRNGTYNCQRPEGHDGKHVCHVMGGVGRWDGPYDPITTQKLPLR